MDFFPISRVPPHLLRIAWYGENGATYAAGTPYSTIFPTGHIPAADFSPLAVT